MLGIPKIICAKLLEDCSLYVTFDNGQIKIYSYEKLFERSEFLNLKHKSLLNSFIVEPGGYALSWNDEVDISENELWVNGEFI